MVQGCSNYFNDALNISAALEGPLLRAGVEVFNFFHTMRHCDSADAALNSSLKPAVHQFIGKMGSRIVDSYISVLQLIQAYEPPVDAVILTRFDVVFKTDLAGLKLDWSKVNLEARAKKVGLPGNPKFPVKNKVGDLFHVLPAKFIIPMIKALKESGKEKFGPAHFITHPLERSIGLGNLTSIAEGFHASYLQIDRSCALLETVCERGPELAHVASELSEFRVRNRKEREFPSWLKKVAIAYHGNYMKRTKFHVNEENTGFVGDKVRLPLLEPPKSFFVIRFAPLFFAYCFCFGLASRVAPSTLTPL